MGYSKDLPTDVLLDIITGLPAESILHCKSVCKQWRDLVSHHPLFYQMYLTRRDDFDSGKLSFLVKFEEQLHYFEYNEKNDDETPLHIIRRININPPFNDSSYKILGSCNGLVCLHDWLHHDYCILNSITREYVILPKIKRDSDDWYPHYSCGFGYLSSTNEYKVVDFYRFSRETDFLEVVVYTLGSGNGWRNVGKLEYTYYDEPVVYANGALHLMDNTGDRILIFDLTVEKFREPIFPPPMPHLSWGYHCTLGEFGGVLYYAISYAGIDTHDDVWLYKEKNDNLGMKRLGWSKEFQLSNSQVFALTKSGTKKFQVSKSQAFALTKSGGVLCFNDCCLSICDAKALTSIKLVGLLDTWSRQINQVIPHRNTLVSLKELGEEDIKILNQLKLRRQEAMIGRLSC